MLSQTQILILSSIAHQERTMADIARATHLTKPNLSRHLDRMCNEGWILRREASERKVYYVSLPEARFREKLRSADTELVNSIFTARTVSGVKPKLVCGFDMNLSPEQHQEVLYNYLFTQYENTEEQMSPELFLLRYKDAEVALISHTFSFLTSDMLLQCPSIKHVIYMGKFASEYIDRSIFEAAGISYWDMSSPDMNFLRSSSIEFMLGAILNILRPTQKAELQIKVTGWSSAVSRKDLSGEEIRGKTVGIIGVDNSAKYVSPVLRQLGALVRFADPDHKECDVFDLGTDRLYSVRDLFETCDMVIYTDNYYKNPPTLTPYLANSNVTYLLVLGEYAYDADFMQACRQSILASRLRGLHLDYWSAKRYVETDRERLDLLDMVMYLPGVRITPFVGPATVQANVRRNDFAISLLNNIKETYYVD